MTSNYDAIIIGTGQSGPALAARLHKEGQKTAIIERKLVGGTCVNGFISIIRCFHAIGHIPGKHSLSK